VGDFAVSGRMFDLCDIARFSSVAIYATSATFDLGDLCDIGDVRPLPHREVLFRSSPRAACRFQ